MQKFEEQVKEITGRQVTVHAWVGQKLKEKNSAMNKEMKQDAKKAGKPGAEKMEKVKGYEVKEVKDKVTERNFKIGMGLIVALFALGLVSIGWFRTKRSDERRSEESSA
jgi:cobalamin biosynthesis Mg chelatase CobN